MDIQRPPRTARSEAPDERMPAMAGGRRGGTGRLPGRPVPGGAR